MCVYLRTSSTVARAPPRSGGCSPCCTYTTGWTWLTVGNARRLGRQSLRMLCVCAGANNTIHPCRYHSGWAGTGGHSGIHRRAGGWVLRCDGFGNTSSLSEWKKTVFLLNDKVFSLFSITRSPLGSRQAFDEGKLLSSLLVFETLSDLF